MTLHFVSDLYFFVHDDSNLFIRSLEMDRPVDVQTPLAYSGLEMLDHMNYKMKMRSNGSCEIYIN